MDNEQTTTPQEKPTLSQLWQDIKKHKKLYYKVLSITFIVSVIITLSIPNYYKCTVKLAPELSGSNKTGSLASLASSFGIKLGSNNMGSEALFPTLYPDLMNSVAFRTSLFPVKVHLSDDSTTTTYSYYNYLKDVQKRPWWSSAFNATKETIVDAVMSIFSIEPEVSDSVNPFMLTKEQYKIVKKMEDLVTCDVDNKTLVITIDVTDNDPLIAATMADSVQMRLQDFITKYRTRKARLDLEYNRKIFKEAKQRYETARKRYASYADANRKVLFEEARSERTRLENEMNLQYQAYSLQSAQLQQAEAKVQEDTPAFTILQPASVPIKKNGPKRSIICLLFLFLLFICTTIYFLKKEGKLIIYLSSYFSKGKGNRSDSKSDDVEEFYVLAKYPNNAKEQ